MREKLFYGSFSLILEGVFDYLSKPKLGTFEPTKVDLTLRSIPGSLLVSALGYIDEVAHMSK